MISIGANGFQLFVNYIVAIIVAVVLALALRLPLLPEKPIRFSWTKSALYNGLLIAIIVGVFSAIFVKYLFDYVFPSPQGGSE